jgi:general secretion pathway protein G
MAVIMEANASRALMISRAATRRTPREAGFSLIEMIIVLIILALLATAAIPLLRNSVIRERESELHEGLRELRRAIDQYKAFVDANPQVAEALKRDGMWTESGYPKSLEILVKGIDLKQPGIEDKRVKFLRRIPRDPMTNSAEWGLRGYSDSPTSTSWNGEDVFDVYSKADGVGLDGTKYRDW